VDYRRNSSNSVAARLFRTEHKYALPAHRQLDSYPDRYRGHSNHLEPPWGGVTLSASWLAPPLIVPPIKGQPVAVQSEHSLNGNTMNLIRRRVATMLILPFLALALFACESTTAPLTGYFDTPQSSYAAAQSTLDYGQSQMNDLAHQATGVGLRMDQAANAVQQATLDYSQRADDGVGLPGHHALPEHGSGCCNAAGNH
jgi:hypothetical protein